MSSFSSGVFFNYMMSLRCCLAASQSIAALLIVVLSMDTSALSGNTRMYTNLRQLNPDILIKSANSFEEPN